MEIDQKRDHDIDEIGERNFVGLGVAIEDCEQ
jgi:hypothetical protein